MSGRAEGLNDIFDHSVKVAENLNTKGGTIKDTPTDDLDIVNKKYVDGADALLVPYTGATGDVDLGVHKLEFTDGGDTAEIYKSGTSLIINNEGLNLDFKINSNLVFRWNGLTGDFEPGSDDTFSFGTSSKQWKDLYLSGNLDLGTNTITDGAMTGAWDMNSGIMTEVNIDTGNIANAVVNTEWDLAYDHSIDNSQAHSDYLINNGDDVSSGKLRVTGLGVGKSASTGLLDVQRVGSSTSSWYTIARLYYSTTGTPASGIGSAFSLRAEGLGGNGKNTGYYAGTLYNVANDAEQGEMIINPDWHDSKVGRAYRALKVRAVAEDEILVHWDKGNLKLTAGSISSATKTITASADNTDVSGVNTLWVTTASGAVVLGGLTGGVDGQVLYIVRKDTTNDLTLEHAEGAGDQDFIMHSGTDETIDSGGVVLVCDGSDWYDCSHAKHV